MKFKSRLYNSEMELQQFIQSNLDGRDYENGAVEAAQDTADNTAKAFARLIEILVERNQLTKNEVITIVTGYTDPRCLEEY